MNDFRWNPYNSVITCNCNTVSGCFVLICEKIFLQPNCNALAMPMYNLTKRGKRACYLKAVGVNITNIRSSLHLFWNVELDLRHYFEINVVSVRNDDLLGRLLLLGQIWRLGFWARGRSWVCRRGRSRRQFSATRMLRVPTDFLVLATFSCSWANPRTIARSLPFVRATTVTGGVYKLTLPELDLISAISSFQTAQSLARQRVGNSQMPQPRLLSLHFCTWAWQRCSCESR